MKLTYKRFNSFLIEKYPDFKSSKYYHKDDIDLNYPFLASFTLYFLDEFRDNNLKFTNEILQLMENLYYGADKELSNLIGIEFIEALLSNMESTEYEQFLGLFASRKFKEEFLHWENHGILAGPRKRRE